jgi:hypothetical protein
MSRCRCEPNAVKAAICLGLLLAAGLVMLPFAPGADEEPATGQSAADEENAVAPVFADARPAENPAGLSLIVDDRKVLGWISGTKDYAGREVRITAGDHERIAILQDDNTFTWHYRVKEPVTAAFTVGELKAAEQLKPAEPVRPAVFFVVDRTAYRPHQMLQFAGFLREPDRRGEFVPLAGREVEVTLTSQKKKTTAARLKLVSDDFGRITGQYTFSAADALDTYELAIEGFAGKAEVALAEFRKAKVRLKIDGATDGNELKLVFQAVDFLDKPVPGTKLRFTAQVIRDRARRRAYPLKAEQFAYHEDWPPALVDAEGLEEDEQLLWEAGFPVPLTGRRGSTTVLAQHQGDLAMDKSGYAEQTLTLNKEWFQGGCSVLVQGVLVDYNGREQRAARRISLGETGAEKTANRVELVLPKRRYATGETIRVHVRPRDARGEPVEAAAVLVAMKLSPAAPTAPPAYPFLQQSAIRSSYPYGMEYGAAFPLWRASSRRPPWHYLRLAEQTGAARTTVTATTVRDGVATLKLEEPGPYKLVCYAEPAGGGKLTGEVGCIVRREEEMPGLVLDLDRDVVETGEVLCGRLHSRFADARVLLVIRDSSGVRWWKTCRLEGSTLRFRERLPDGLHYGCRVEAQYLDAAGKTHVAGRFLRVYPKGRVLSVEAACGEIYGPGDDVKLDLAVNRREPVDLVVSVYDQSLLGIAPDKSADVRSFFLADERVRANAAKETLRRELAGVTVRQLVEKAEGMLEEDPKMVETPEGAMIRQTVDHYRHSNLVNGPNLLVLLRLAGIDAYGDPVYSRYFGSGWRWQFDREKEEKSPMRLAALLDHERSGWRLHLRFSGTAVVLFEYHPSNLEHLLQYAQTPGGLWRSQMYGLRSARGDARYSVAANAMFSDLPMLSGQAFISHLPAPEAQVELIDVDQPGIDVRRDFSDAAYFNAAVRTDASGKASVRFKLPDSLTNWRVVVTAISPRMHVGHMKTSFRTFKPIMVWPMVPRTFSEGDEVKLYASVHNRTDQPQKIDVSLKVQNGEVLTPRQLQVTVPPKEQVPVYWTFRPEKAGFTQLLMSAVCEAGSDASLKRLPVRRLAAEQVVTRSGFCRDSTTLAVPGDVHLEDSDLEVTLVPSIADDLVQSLGYLVEYPHGCVEQTMSRFLPAIKVAQTLERLNIENPELQKKLPDVVAAGIKRLLELQKPDGGWGWHGGSRTHEMMTPYALYGLLEAEKAGYTIPNEEAIQKGLNRLRSFIDSMGEKQAADRIYCTYVYALRHDVPKPVWDFIQTQLDGDKLSDYALAMSLELAARSGKRDLAARLAASLYARAQRTDGTIYWTTANFSRWGNDRFEITAAVLKALVALDPEDEMIPGILQFFATTKRGNRWNSTKATAVVIYAMCDYLATQDYSPGAPRVVSVTVNEGKPQTVRLTDGQSPSLKVAGVSLRHGANRIGFDGHVPGAMYRAVFRYWQSSRRIDPMEAGLTVSRQLFLLNDQGAQIGEVKPGETVPRGCYLESVVTVRHKLGQSMRYVLVENPKPASAEILPETDERFKRSSTPYVLREDKTSGVVYHHEQTGSSITDRSVLHVELAGDYVLPPATVELMYEPHVRGHSGTFPLKVADEEPKTAAR